MLTLYHFGDAVCSSASRGSQPQFGIKRDGENLWHCFTISSFERIQRAASSCMIMDDLFDHLLDFSHDYTRTTEPLKTPEIDQEDDDKNHILGQGGLTTNKKRPTRAKIPGCSVLSLPDRTSAKPKRAKFDRRRRREVARVRHIGACLRCKAMRISVGRPCMSERCHTD